MVALHPSQAGGGALCVGECSFSPELDRATGPKLIGSPHFSYSCLEAKDTSFPPVIHSFIPPKHKLHSSL